MLSASQVRSWRLRRCQPGVGHCIVNLVCLVICLSGCTAQAASMPSPNTETPPATGGSSIAPAEQVRPAPSQSVEFIPRRLTLPGHASAAVLPAATVDGVLKVPEDVRHVGWWDGSAWAGEPFGSTVIAGHVDSATEGGFFARLLRIRVGDTITLQADSHRLKYRVTSVRRVARTALATDSEALKQTGSHRLVLITCTGNYRRDHGGYESNLLVIAKPRGSAR
jgi:LPXTG-site transpeptidase (sortase) family protein